MNMVKKIIAVFLAMIILALSLPIATVFAADSDMRYGKTKLNADQQYVYDKIVAGCENATADIKIDISGKSMDFNDLSFIFNMFYSDYPEYFWVTGGYGAGIEQIGSTATLSVQPTYYMTGSALTSAKSAYNAKVNELTSGLSGSEYDKAKTLHDRLIDTVDYVSTPNDQNSYGALVEGEAVCNGYAKAYQHLMNKADIPTWYVRGNSVNPTTGEPIGHAWNIVKIDGQWYYTDVTWDDQKENTLYAYFNITTKQLEEDHIIEDIPDTTRDYKGLVPNATEKAANYYEKNKLVFSSYNKSQIADLLKNTPGHSVQVYISGDPNKFDNDFWGNCQALFNDIGAAGGTVLPLGRVRMISVTIVESGHTHKTQTTKQQINPTCLTNGTKAYYVCSCGLKFSDPACTKQIVNESELNIPASSHTPSGWKNDASNHWKECTKCGSETANTRGTHNDSNKDYKCDSCGYGLPKPDQNGNIVIGGGNSNNNNSSQTSTDNTTSTDTSSTDNSSTESDVESTPSSTDETESVIIESEEIIETVGGSLYGKAQTNPLPIKIIIICAAAAAVVAAGVTVTVVLISKKNKPEI